MKKIKEKWNKFTKSQKILAIIVGAFIVCIIMASCSNPDKLEEGYEKGSSNTKQEQQKEEPAVEDKSEPEEDSEPEPELGDAGDEYVPPKEAANDKEYSIEDMDQTVLSIFRENYDPSSYDVSIGTNNGVTNIKIIAYDIDLSGFTQDQIDYALSSTNLHETNEELVESVKTAYNNVGYDVNVSLKTYDVNGTLIDSVYK